MDITNENFVATLPEITQTIQDCNFIAIDTELSGLMREKNLNRFDLPEERFAKSVELSRGYFIMQFGLSCFTRKDDLHYTNRTFNFYIFPQAHESYGDRNRTFSVQAHAIQFLIEHGFDFNKLFKHGISYLTFQEKKVLTAQLKSDMKTRSQVEFESTGLPKFVPSSLSAYCRNWMDKAKKFVDERRTQSSTYVQQITDSQNNHVETADNILELRDSTTHHKRTMMRRVLECLPIYDSIEIHQKTDAKTSETFLYISYIDRKLKNEKERNRLIVAKGFLEVIEIIVLSKKPIVGHNLSLDLIQIISQFMEPLSDDYSSFKETCHSLFPLIYDTKYIAHAILDPDTLTNNQSRLEDLYCQLKDSDCFPKIQVDHLGEFIDENQMPHQAGYDAFMSGYCFLALCEGYSKEKKKFKYNKMSEAASAEPVPLVHQQLIMEDFANRVHLSYSYDFRFFNLSGEEEEPDRNHVFYLEFPSTWALDDIFQVFSQHSGVTASRLTKTTALCALRDPKQTSSVLTKINKLKGISANYKIYTYDAYLDNFKPKKVKASRGDCDVEFSDA